MSLIQIDSHDHYTDVTTKYSSDSTAVITAGLGRKGTFGIVTNGSTAFTLDRGSNGVAFSSLTLYRGISINVTVLPGSTQTLLQFKETDGTNHVCIGLRADGKIQAFRGNTGGTSLATSASPIAIATEYYFEIRVFVDDAAGRVVVRLWTNSTTHSDIIDFTGDTKNAGTGLLAKITHGTGVSAVWDDAYLCDGNGSAFNNFLGNKHIQACFPEAAGTYTGWTPFPSSPNYSNVNENPPDTATYNFAPSETGDTDTFGIQNVDGDVSAACVNLCTEQDVAEADGISAVMRYNSVDLLSTQKIPTTAFQIYQFPFETAADGSAWTETIFNNSEAGYTISTGLTYWLLPYLAAYNAGTAVGVSPANRVQVARIFFPYNMLVSRIDVNITTGDAGKKWGTGLYSADGNTRIIDSGPLDAGSAVQVHSTFTAVEVPAGMYWYAWTSDSTVTRASTLVINLLAAQVRDNGTSQYGHAANASVAGQLPTTLGVITADTPAADSIPMTGLH